MKKILFAFCLVLVSGGLGGQTEESLIPLGQSFSDGNVYLRRPERVDLLKWISRPNLLSTDVRVVETEWPQKLRIVSVDLELKAVGKSYLVDRKGYEEDLTKISQGSPKLNVMRYAAASKTAVQDSWVMALPTDWELSEVHFPAKAKARPVTAEERREIKRVRSYGGSAPYLENAKILFTAKVKKGPYQLIVSRCEDPGSSGQFQKIYIVELFKGLKNITSQILSQSSGAF